MSATKVPTFEEMMALFAENERKFDRALEKSREEWEKRMKKTDEIVGRLGNRIGELIEAMVEGGIIRLFKKLGYDFDRCCRRMRFGKEELGTRCEVDLFLENGDYALLVEVKMNLSVENVQEHIEQLEKFRKDASSKGDKRRFIGAVGGGVVLESVQNYALRQGFFVVKQSGDNVEIIPPEGEPRVW